MAIELKKLPKSKSGHPRYGFLSWTIVRTEKRTFEIYDRGVRVINAATLLAARKYIERVTFAS